MRNIYCKMLNCLKYTLFSAFCVFQLIAAQQLAGQNIQLTFSFVSPKCFGYTDGTVTANPTGGAVPYGYHWENGQSGQTNFGVGAGTYSVTVTDQNGLTAIGSTTVTQPSQVVAAIAPIGFSCTTTGGTLGGSATGGTPPYTYSWTGGATNQTVPANSVGAYILTVTDANGCSDLETFFVYPPLDVTVEVENIPCFMFCDGVARANVTGGVYPYSYLWNTGAMTQQISALPPGWYSVTVTDAVGCVKIDSAYVYEPPAITISFSTITPACGGNTGSVTAQASGGTPPFTYLWNYLNTVGPTLSNVPSGTYFVRVRDANGCQKDSSVVIPAGPGLNVTLSIQKATCQGVDDGTVTAIVTPATGNYAYHWNIQSANTPSLNGIAAGTPVCVTVTDNTTGCQGIACDVVGTHTTIGLQVTDTDVSCLGDLTGTATALAYNGAEPYNYVWTYPNSNMVNGAAISGLGTGSYSVKVTDDQGCTAVGVADVGVLSNLHAAYEVSVVECVGSSIKVRFTDKSTDSGSTIVAWSWHIAWGSGSFDSNDQNPTVLNLPSNETGTAQLTVTSAAGCTAFISGPFTVDSLPNVYINVNSPAFNCDGSPVHIHVTGDPNYTYVWFPGSYLSPDPDHPGPQNVIANPPQDQIYTLVAGNGSCVDTLQVEVLHHTPLALSVGPHEVVACASTATLTATLSATATVQWFDPSGALLATGTSITVPATAMPTMYKVVATDALGCVQTDSVLVTGKQVSIALSVPAEVFDCNNAPININVTGAPANTYTWSPMTGLTLVMGGPNVIANPTQTQLYTLIAANGLCSDTAQVKVLRVAPINLALNTHNLAVCTPTALLTATVNANANVTSIQWFDPNNILVGSGPSISLPATATPTWYYVVAKDLLGCIETDSVLVTGNAVSVAVTGPAEVVDCLNAPVPLHATGTPGASYIWVPAMGISDPNSPNVTADPSVTTTYQVIASKGLCADTAQVKVIRVVPIDLLLGDTAVLSCLENQELQVSFNLASNAQIVWYPTLETGTTITVPVTAVPTVYTAVATDPYGCTQSVAATVSGHPANVEILANTPTTLCENEVLSLTAINQNPTDTLTYHWTAVPGMVITPNNEPNVSITGMAGNYVILVEAVNQFGCRDSEQIPVTFSPGGSLAGQISVQNCGGLTVTFHNLATTIPGTWNFGDNSQTSMENDPAHNYGSAGSYQVTFTPLNADCIAPFDTMVQIQTAPIVDPAITSNLVNCTDVAVYNFVGQPTGTNFSWQWTVDGQASADQNPTFTFTQTGPITAYLTVTDALTGCVGVDSLPVDVQVIDDKIGPDTMVCKGIAVQLNPNFNPAFSYLWTANPADASLMDPTNPNPTVTPTEITTYTVVISNGHGCSVAYSKTVNPQGSTVVSAGPDQVVCSDDPITLTVVNPAGSNYQWSQSPNFNTIIGEGSSIEITPEKNGVYYVRTGGSGDCLGFGEVHVNNAEVNVDALPKDQNVCLGESTQLVVTNLDSDDQLQYSWSPGLDPIANPTVTPASTTSYSVIVTNQVYSQCKDTVTFNVTVADLAVTAQVVGKDTICPGQTAQLQANATGTGTVFTYSWTPAGSLNNPNIANPSARPDVETVYTVTATADGLCPQTASVTIHFQGDQCMEPSIFVPKAFTPNEDGNNDFFIVRGVNIKELYMVVWDRWGEKVYETSDTAAQGWDGTYQGASLTPDAYAWYVKATCGNGAVYEKKGNVTLLK